MKKSQHTSKGLPQAVQLETAKNINDSFIIDNAKFKVFDPELDITYSDKIIAQILAVEAVPPDYVLVALQMQESSRVMKLMASSLANVRGVRYFVEKAFPDEKLHLYEFGYPELSKVINSQSRFILFFKNFNVSLIKYKTELLSKGLQQSVIDECIQSAIDMDSANIKQEQAKKARYIATGTRIKAYDELWEMIGNVAKAGKIIFEDEPDFQRNYLLDNSPKKKTVKIADAEVNTAIFQGCITDTATSEIIEDAMIEIVGTNINGTTDEDGEFYLDNITPGSYTIRIVALGYKEIQKTGIELSSDNEEQEFDFTLEKLIAE